MPQMMPMNWIMLFLFFTLMFLMFIIMNYYSYNLKSSKMTNNKLINKNNFNWKW